MSEFYKSEIEPIDLSVFRRLVLSDDYRKAYNLVAEYTVATTEERIIKMLEDLDRHGTTHSEFCAARHAYAAKAIALIKGENR